ncbi:MAG TPA: Gfo/Idh/MocA family oxidoreductase, partial [Cyclobacteriaceae bacterium]|nr:Gfo/Idh/MocA family oxidoreductase [Cyclobacteriaceae bacterium]
MDRRSFVKNTSLTAAAISILPSTSLFAQKQKVKLGIIGTGLRGQNHLELLLLRSDVDVVAICDINDRMLTDAQDLVKKSGKAMPKIFTGDVNAWKKLVEIKDLDGVIIATPWELHAPMIIGSLEAGIKYVGTEVILGITLQDHWDVVK